MTKHLLIKYICGDTSEDEDILIHKWLKSNTMNLKYYIELKSAWIFENMPQEKSNEDISDIRLIYRKSKENIFLKKLPIVAVIIALLGFNLYLLIDRYSNKTIIPHTQVLLRDLPAEYKHTIYTNKGAKAQVDLPDGSKVWLNSDSKIIFPDKFLGSTREVLISGEAFFSVVKDSLKPMIVSTNKNFKIRVLGTKFNIKSYDNDQESKTTLVSGSVELIDVKPNIGEIVLAKLVNAQTYTIKNNAPIGIIEKLDTTKQIAWKNGYLIFDSTPLSEIIKQLERWHGIKFKVEDTTILNYKYTANFNSESIIQIMEMFKFTSKIDYFIKDNTICLKRKELD
ncbi:MAG: FecR family protein [Clostridia bacterium]